MELPLAGRIAAGLPLEAIQDYETIAIPSDMIGKDVTYVLQVKGDSMEGDHVLDGDYVIVEKRPTAKDGDMVVALVRNTEATLKRYHREPGKIRLEPANPAYPVMVFNEEEVTIQGVVVGILRKYGSKKQGFHDRTVHPAHRRGRVFRFRGAGPSPGTPRASRYRRGRRSWGRVGCFL